MASQLIGTTKTGWFNPGVNPPPFDMKLLVLDRFDVLDLKGREDLLYWLDAMAEDGEIDTALVFGTLKALPAQLPETIGAVWIDNGAAGQIKEAA